MALIPQLANNCAVVIMHKYYFTKDGSKISKRVQEMIKKSKLKTILQIKAVFKNEVPDDTIYVSSGTCKLCI